MTNTDTHIGRDIHSRDSECGGYIVCLERDATKECGKLYTVHKASNTMVDIDTVHRLPALLLAPYLVDVAKRLRNRRGQA